MSSLYVLVGGFEYEGSDVLGVFASVEAAEAAEAGREEYTEARNSGRLGNHSGGGIKEFDHLRG